jgi:allantoin racemase
VVCTERGPETIESTYDVAYVILPTVELVKKANQEGYNTVIIACFSHPGLETAKEISDILVMGIGESSYHMAAMLGLKFSIMTTRKERIPAKREHVYRKGLEHFLASVRSLDLSVAETDADSKRTKKRILEVAQKAVEEDGAEVIILGCVGMAGYAPEIEEKLKVKVIDPTTMAIKLTEAIVDLELVHSKVGLFSTPPEKLFK